jgi:hypothetical protein
MEALDSMAVETNRTAFLLENIHALLSNVMHSVPDGSSGKDAIEIYAVN